MAGRWQPTGPRHPQQARRQIRESAPEDDLHPARFGAVGKAQHGGGNGEPQQDTDHFRGDQREAQELVEVEDPDDSRQGKDPTVDAR